MFLEKPYHIEEAFTSQFCDNLLHLGEQKQIEEAKIKDGNQVNRQSKVSWIKDKQVEITKAINRVNKKNNWNFELSAIEPLQYTIYGEKDFYDWHIDSHTKPYDNGLIRKISFTICLNEDYEGGEFELCTPTPKKLDKNIILNDLVLGTVISFPSFIWHKVHPVTSGVRKVLVGWTLGPTFK